MYIVSLETEENESNGYSPFEKPYTNVKEEIYKWACYSIRKLHQNNIEATTDFNANTMNAPDQNLTGVSAYINRIRSFYDNSWAGGSVEYLNKMYGDDNILPARFVNYPLMRNKMDWMQGQYESAPVDLTLAAIDPESVDKKVKQRSAKLFLKLMLPFIESMEQMTGTQLENDKQVPPDIDKFNSMGYKQIHETYMSKLIEYNFYKHSWFAELSKGFKETALYGFTSLTLDAINTKSVKIRKDRLDTMIFDWECESDFGEDAMYKGSARNMSLAEITREYVVEDKYMDAIKEDPEIATKHTNETRIKSHYPVVDLLWKAKIDKKVKKIPNKFLKDKFIYKILEDGSEETTKKGKYEILTIEAYEWFHGVLVDDRVLIKAEPFWAPRKYEELNDVINPFIVPLFNRMDTYKPNGIGEMILNAQELFNEVMFLLELEIATSPGKIVEYNIKGKPKNVPMTEIFYNMRANKLIQTNKDQTGGASSFSTADLSPNAATIYMNILMFIEGFVDRLVGITQFAQGNVPQDTYVGTLKTAIEQSNFTTKPFYTFYREAVRKLLKSAACMIKELNEGNNESLAIIIPDVGVDYFNIDGNIPFGEYDFFYKDGSEQEQKRQLLLNLGQVALQSGAVAFKEIKDIIMLKDLNEINNKLDRAFTQYEQKKEEAAKIENQIRQQENQMPQELLKLKGQIDLLLKQQVGADGLKIAEKYAQEKMKSLILEKELENQQ